jgi:hypothetical protein
MSVITLDASGVIHPLPESFIMSKYLLSSTTMTQLMTIEGNASMPTVNFVNFYCIMLNSFYLDISNPVEMWRSR